MRPKIVFGIQSALHNPDTLAQLAAALGDHEVVVHHDFSQQAEFKVDAPNVHIIPDFVKTGWAAWGLMQGIVKTIEFANDKFDYDYLQILSPVDLPILPIKDFEAYIAKNDHDAAIDVIDLTADEMAFMTFAYRAYSPENSMRYRVLWRLRELYFGAGHKTHNVGGLSIPDDYARRPGGGPTVAARLARAMTRRYVAAYQKYRDQQFKFPMMAGGSWFGGNRAACTYLVEQAQRPEVEKRFETMFCACEMMISTVFAASDFRLAPSNHLISTFDGPRPVWIEPQDLPEITGSGRFFARKFPDDVRAPVRQRLLDQIRVSQSEPVIV